jgi:hypothetical protein
VPGPAEPELASEASSGDLIFPEASGSDFKNFS